MESRELMPNTNTGESRPQIPRTAGSTAPRGRCSPPDQGNPYPFRVEVTMDVKIKRLHPQAVLPVYTTAGAGCFDLHTIDHNTVFPGGSTVFNTGLAIEVPEGYVMMVYSRSGHGFTHGLRLSNCVGIIDSDYRGEVKISIRNDGVMPFRINVGSRIAQAMIVPVPRIAFVEGDLSETTRGTGGFGSTG